MKKFQIALFTVFLFSVFLLTGCEKKTDTPEDQTKTTQDTIQTPVNPEDTVKEETAPDISGNWKGSFYNRTMTLNITKQDNMEFEGQTVVNWAQPLRMEVKGTFDPKTREIKFEDQSNSKDAGTYTGTLSEDLTAFTGKFALKSGTGRDFNVKLKKQ